MSEGPTDRQIERVREALERHDSELSSDEQAPEDEGEETAEDGEEDG